MEQKGNVAFSPELEESPEAGQVKKEQRVFNLIILDESGSMETIAEQAVSGLNETFQTISAAQRDHQEQKHFISFVTFNGIAIRTIMDRLPVDNGMLRKWTDYRPDACTPLLDAMGRSLNELKKHVGEEDVVLVTIITDGMENASREYRGSDIKRLVADLKEKGWVFAYIGTNQDVDAVAVDLGIQSRMKYDYSGEGVACMCRVESRSRKTFFDRLSREGSRFLREEDYDYFKTDDDEKTEGE